MYVPKIHQIEKNKMDENGMKNDEKTGLRVFRMPGVKPEEVHQDYGLWIFRYSSSEKTQAEQVRPEKRYFEFYSISHMYDGQGVFSLGQAPWESVSPGDCIIITPGTVHAYGADTGSVYCEDSINFTGPVADRLFKCGIIADGKFHLGKVRKLQQIIEYANDPASEAQLRASFELQKLLTELYFERLEHSQKEYPLIQELLNELSANPRRWWSVQEMAELCHLSIDHFRRVFFQYTGVKPKQYVDRLKLNLAAELLLSGKYPISKIAEHTGYLDQYHFSRRFKAVMGMSPRQYRESMAIKR